MGRDKATELREALSHNTRLLAMINEHDDALAAKDAEIERLRNTVDGLEADLASALGVLCRRGGDEGREWVRLNYPLWAGSETHERAPVPRQDRRSGVSGHGEPPDTPNGDTRG